MDDGNVCLQSSPYTVYKLVGNETLPTKRFAGAHLWETHTWRTKKGNEPLIPHIIYVVVDINQPYWTKIVGMNATPSTE